MIPFLQGGDATNKELALGDNGTAEPGTQAGTAPAPVSAAKGAAAPKPELSAEMREAMAMDPVRTWASMFSAGLSL